MPLDVCLGPCRVIHCVGAARAEPEHVRNTLTDVPPRALLRTYAQVPQIAWDTDFAAVVPKVITLVVTHGTKLIGVDTASLDPRTSKTMDAYHAMGKYGLAILKGPVLDEVPAGGCELIVLPLRLATFDASLVRAVPRSPP